jgi:hypothetical protein
VEAQAKSGTSAVDAGLQGPAMISVRHQARP